MQMSDCWKTFLTHRTLARSAKAIVSTASWNETLSVLLFCFQPHERTVKHQRERNEWIKLFSLNAKRKSTKRWLKSNFPVWNQFPHFTRNWKWIFFPLFALFQSRLVSPWLGVLFCEAWRDGNLFSFFLLVFHERQICCTLLQRPEWKRCKIYEAFRFLKFALWGN